MNSRIKILLVIFAIASICFLGLYKLSKAFSPGSYPNAERYELNYEESKVREAIAVFKSEHPVYIVPSVTINGLPVADLIDDTASSSHFSAVYFYDKSENKIFHCWTRPGNEITETTLAFDAVHDGLNIGNWKEINEDYGYSENNRLKGKFEDEILKPIQTILETKK